MENAVRPGSSRLYAWNVFLLILDTITPHMHLDNSVEGPKSNLSRQTMMVLAVTLHNIPEGMAVGVLYASWISGTTTITRAAALHWQSE